MKIQPPTNRLNTSVRINGRGGLSHVQRLLREAQDAGTHMKRARALDKATRFITRWYKKAKKSK